MTKTSVLITGASTGIGAVYAERFARRGHDLILVARDKAKLETLADRLRQENGISVDVLPADLTVAGDLAAVEARLREDSGIGILINNAGMAQSGSFTEQTPESIDKVIALNITALTRLARAAAPRFAEAGEGSIVNISSVLGLAPEYGLTVYGATKAFVLFLSQGLNVELASKGVYIQAVLPAGTYTEIWDRSGIGTSDSVKFMEVGELVDAALVGFDRRELITIPPLQNAESWDTLNTSRQALFSDIKQSEVAQRYKAI